MVYHTPAYYGLAEADIDSVQPEIEFSPQFNPQKTEVSLSYFNMPTISNALQGVPKSMTTAMPSRMKFDHVFSSVDGFTWLDATANSGADLTNNLTTAAWLVSASALYQPEALPRASPQLNADMGNPMNYDQFINLYDRYTVINSEIRVDAYNTHTKAAIVGITPVPTGTTVIKNNGQYEEMYGTVFATCIPGEVKTLHNAVVPHKFLGRNAPLSDGALAGEPNASVTADKYPSVGLDWHVWSHGFGSTGNSDTAVDFASYVSFHITVRYSVIWHSPRNLGRSGAHKDDAPNNPP